MTDAIQSAEPAEAPVARPGIRHELVRRPLWWVGAVLVVGFVLLGILGPWLVDAPRSDQGPLLAGPSGRDPFGTDDLGRSVFSQVAWGARTSLLVAVVASVIATVVGAAVGLLSAFFPRLDTIFGVIVDVMLSLPPLPLMIVVAASLGANLRTTILVIGLTAWPEVARLIRSGAQQVVSMPFVDAARIVGERAWTIIMREIVPSVVPLIIVAVLMIASRAIITEAALSFLGLGDPSAWSWGRIMQNAQRSNVLSFAWWMTLFPSLALLLTTLGVSLAGNQYSDARNRRLHQRR